jgi:hypothetical protein
VGAAPKDLGGGGLTLAAIFFDVRFCRFAGMVPCVLMVAVGELCVMRGGFMFSSFVMFGGFLVVASRVLVMFRCLVMMICCFL